MTRARRTLCVPRGWAPATAASVVGLLERLADAVWAEYGEAVTAWRDQQHEDGVLPGTDDEDAEPGGPPDVCSPDAWNRR